MVAMETIVFSSGAVAQVRVMPPHVYARFLAQFAETAEPEPEPTVIRTTADGSQEIHPLTPDMPEYPAWQEEWGAWAARNEDVRKVRRNKWSDVMMDHCMVSWRWDEDGPDITEPPDAWEFPPALIRGGIQPTGNRRVDYIRHAVAITNVDQLMFQWVAIDRSGDLTEEEIEAQLAGFRSSVGDRRSFIREAFGRGDTDLPEHVSRGDGSAEGKRDSFARRLVRFITRR